MAVSLTSYPRTSGRGGSDLVKFGNLLQALDAAMALNMEQAAQDLLATLQSLSSKLPDQDMLVLSVQARNTLAAAKGKGHILGSYFLDAMRTCATHWMRLYPNIASTGLRSREQGVLSSATQATTSVAKRAAAEDAGTVAWLYEASALLGEDMTTRIALNPVAIANTRYRACSHGGQLQYLECGAAYNVNQFIRIQLPDPAAPALVIAGEAKGGASAYGVVKGPRSFMILNGRRNQVISQRDILYPLSRALYMASASPASPAGPERREAGNAIATARQAGVFTYLAVRGQIDTAKGAIAATQEEFKC